MFSVFLEANRTCHVLIQKLRLKQKEKATFKIFYLLKKTLKVVTEVSKPARAPRHRELLQLQAEKAELCTLPKPFILLM